MANQAANLWVTDVGRSWVVLAEKCYPLLKFIKLFQYKHLIFALFGAGCRVFKSPCPDQIFQGLTSKIVGLFLLKIFRGAIWGTKRKPIGRGPCVARRVVLCTTTHSFEYQPAALQQWQTLLIFLQGAGTRPMHPNGPSGWVESSVAAFGRRAPIPLTSCS